MALKLQSHEDDKDTIKRRQKLSVAHYSIYFNCLLKFFSPPTIYYQRDIALSDVSDVPKNSILLNAIPPLPHAFCPGR